MERGQAALIHQTLPDGQIRWGGGCGDVGAAGRGVPDQDVWAGLLKPPILGLFGSVGEYDLIVIMNSHTRDKRVAEFRHCIIKHSGEYADGQASLSHIYALAVCCR